MAPEIDIKRLAGNGDTTEHRLRRFLLYVAGFVWAGSIVELLLAEHTGDWVQYVPFVVSVLGVAAATAVLRLPGRRSFRFLRVASWIAIAASIVGGYKHLAANYELEAEVNASASISTHLWDAFFGASPLLAPGILALAAVLALAAIWRIGPVESVGAED